MRRWLLSILLCTVSACFGGNNDNGMSPTGTPETDAGDGAANESDSTVTAPMDALAEGASADDGPLPIDAAGDAARIADAGTGSGADGSVSSDAQSDVEAGSSSCIRAIFGDHLLTTLGHVFHTGGSVTQSAWTAITLPNPDGGTGPMLDNVVAGAEGQYYACALRGDGSVWCWSTGPTNATSDGELGDGTLTWPATPYTATQVKMQPPDGGAPSALGGITSLSVSAENTYEKPMCAIGAGGHLWCWGPVSPNGGGSALLINSFGSPTSGGSPYAVMIAASATPGDYLTGVTQVSAGSNQICALVGGQVKCWGSNTYGALGTATADGGSVNDSNYPVAVPGLPASPAPSQVWTGNGTVCALIGDKAYCWGQSGYGAVGTGPTMSLDCQGIGHYCEPAGSPVLMAAADGGAGPTLTGVTQLYFGYFFGCAITNAGALLCWGDNGTGGVSYAEPFPLLAGGSPTTVTQVTSRNSGGFPGTGRFAEADGTYHVGQSNHVAVSCE